MPSTYSPNLRVELIATGEQANTWGATTNTNLGTVLEQAISGIAEVSVTSGDATLTTVDGASDQARCMIVKATGTPGTARNIIVPATATKTYVVHNASNANVIIKTAAAGTNATVTIQAGGRQVVYSDGTNVYAGESATSIEIGYLTGVTSAIQTQLDNKQNKVTASGILKGDGSGTITQATAGTDYVIPSGNITGNAGTVTNGVYTVGDQTIGGTKTFSSTIVGNITGTAGAITNGVYTVGDQTIGGTKTFSSTIVGNITGNAATAGTATTATYVTYPVPAGTAMLFVQTSAPTGWTKSSAHNNKALRVVSGSVGSGGSIPFSSLFTSQTLSGNTANHTLTIAEMPAHTHEYTSEYSPYPGTPTSYGSAPIAGPTNTSSTGGGQGHSHGYSIPVDLSVQYVDVIIATKD
jgi:hypothetical protein